MINPCEIIYDGDALADATLGVSAFRSTGGTIKAAYLYVGGNVAGEAVFNIAKNGAALWTAADRLTVSGGASGASKPALEIATALGDVLQLDLEESPAGGVPTPVTLILMIDDGVAEGGGNILTSHDSLLGLENDDHPQYFNEPRGDARYAQAAATTDALAAKADLVGGKVPAAQLPSYVDDVVEYVNLAAFPAVGETGKLYIAIDTDKEYRWSGSTYVWLNPSPGSTDAIPEGATNKYFTAARVWATVLTGIVFTSNAAITAADSILVALGKLQAQITAVIASLANYVPTSYLDTDGTLAANSDTKLATQKAVRTYVAANAGSSGTTLPAGDLNATTNALEKIRTRSVKDLSLAGAYTQTPTFSIHTGQTWATPTLTKTGASGWTSGSLSTESFTGDCIAKWTVDQTVAAGGSKIIGLTSDGSITDGFNQIDYAWLNNDAGDLRIYENGSYKGAFGSGSAVVGDILEIRRAGTTITYYKNGVLQYTSLTASAATLKAAATIFTNGKTMTGFSVSNIPTDFLVEGSVLGWSATSTRFEDRSPAQQATTLLPQINAVSVPANSASAGVKGQQAVDANYLYVCYATNSWKRIALTAF